MSMDPWGNPIDAGSGGYDGVFAIRKSLDGEQSSEYEDKLRFIGIKIGGEEFLLSIDNINEIIMLPNITYVPNSAKYIEGVVNLRGIILPVINLRKMMGLARANVSPATRIIICKDETLGLRVGLLVDHITFVVSLLLDEIDTSMPPPAASGHEILSGVSKSGNIISGVLDLEKILTVAAEGKNLGSEDESAGEGHAA